MSKSKQDAGRGLSNIRVLSHLCLQAVEVERVMSNELQALKQELQRNGSYNRLQDEELISAMREQVNNIHTSSSTCVIHPKSLC